MHASRKIFHGPESFHRTRRRLDPSTRTLVLFECPQLPAPASRSCTKISCTAPLYVPIDRSGLKGGELRARSVFLPPLFDPA